ncbi:MAG: hypothetical protein GTO41_23495, partial [Burkholderiales bacterium]|nr:hypothetical protein [Burkholderiales bacterium]
MDEQTKIATTTGGAIGISAVASLKKWPAVVGAGAFAVVALTGYLKSGSVESVTLARLIWLWELYVFAHLGLSFLIAAM